MRQFLFAALAVLSLSAAVAPAYAASTVAGDRSATLMQRSGDYSGGN